MLRLLFVEDDIAVTQSKMSGQVSEFSILDLNLNGKNRAELSPGVLIINHDAKDVVVASYGNLRTASKPIRHGATDVIAVPLTIEEIDYALNRPGSPAMPVSEDITTPDKAGDTQIVEFVEKNDCKVLQTARALAMHRSLLQRFLEKSKTGVSANGEGRTDTAFGRAKRIDWSWSSMMPTGE